MLGFSKKSSASVTVEKAFEELSPINNITLIDVREPEEYQEGHIQHSISLPLGHIKEQISQLVPIKQTPIFVYCRSDNRSQQAANLLTNLDYQHVFFITGGILAWQDKGYPIEK